MPAARPSAETATARFGGRRLRVLLIALGLAGCSNDMWRDATGQGRSGADFNVDYALCQQAGDVAQADAASNGTTSKMQAVSGLLSPLSRGPAIDNCLVARGWQTAASLPAPSLSDSNVTAAAKLRFQPNPNTTRVFLFGLYGSSADKAWFGSSYKLIINGVSDGIFSDSQYIEIESGPGENWNWIGQWCMLQNLAT